MYTLLARDGEIAGPGQTKPGARRCDDRGARQGSGYGLDPVCPAVSGSAYKFTVLTPERVVGLWLDNRSNPDTSFDLPTSPESRRALGEALRAAGVPVRKEGSAQRVVVLLGSLAIALFALSAARVALKLTATGILAAPLAWVFLGTIGFAVGVWWWRQP